MTTAFRSMVYSAEEMIATQRVMNKYLVAVCIGLVVTGALCAASGYGERFLFSASLGMLMGATCYFWVWPASECRSPFWALLALMSGMVVISAVAHFTRLSPFFAGHIWTRSELVLIFATIVFPLIMAWVSLVLLTATNQMPRRTKGLWSVETEVIEKTATRGTTPLRAWLLGLCLWVIACLAAYWVSQDIDSETMLKNQHISIRNGWLAAQFLQKLEGNRENIRFSNGINSGPSSIALRLNKYSEHWATCISLMEQRAREGDVCQLAIDEPIEDKAFREHLMQQGILIYGHPDADSLSTGLPWTSYNPFR